MTKKKINGSKVENIDLSQFFNVKLKWVLKNRHEFQKTHCMKHVPFTIFLFSKHIWKSDGHAKVRYRWYVPMSDGVLLIPTLKFLGLTKVQWSVFQINSSHFMSATVKYDWPPGQSQMLTNLYFLRFVSDWLYIGLSVL